MAPQLEIQIIAVIVAVACALPGTFLVLRKMSMMSDSITHTILLGIVLAFFVTHDLSSPFLILGAALMGVVTVWLTELLSRTRLLAEDAAIGVVFPLLFSIAIILITRYAGAVHLDTDSVLLGELAFAPFDRMIVGGVDIGAKAIYTTGVLLLINLAAITLFFKELKLATFDSMLAAVVGFSPALVHYGLMTLVSLTTVGGQRDSRLSAGGLAGCLDCGEHGGGNGSGISGRVCFCPSQGSDQRPAQTEQSEDRVCQGDAFSPLQSRKQRGRSGGSGD